MKSLYDSKGNKILPLPLAKSDMREGLKNLAFKNFHIGSDTALDCLEESLKKAKEKGLAMTIDQFMQLIDFTRKTIKERTKQ